MVYFLIINHMVNLKTCLVLTILALSVAGNYGSGLSVGPCCEKAAFAISSMGFTPLQGTFAVDGVAGGFTH